MNETTTPDVTTTSTTEPGAARADGTPSPAADREPGFTVHDRRFWACEDTDQAATDAAPAEPRKPTYVEQLEEKIASQEATLREYIEAHKAAAQRFEEARIRMRARIDEEVQQEKERLVTRFFDVLDNLQRTVAAAEQADGTGTHFVALRDGMRIVERQLDAALDSLGLVRTDPVGQPFDPNVHEAVGVVPVADPAADQTVFQVVRSGYQQGERVLRPAMVLVARHSG